MESTASTTHRPSEQVRALSWLALGICCLVPVSRLSRHLSTPSASGDGPAALNEPAVPSPEIRRAASLGYQALVSDWYWIEGVQYYGTPENQSQNFRELSGYLDASTDLDPDFDYVYEFGGLGMPHHDVASHLWYNTKATIRLLQKGMPHRANRWQIPWLLGYSLYAFEGDYEAAGRATEIAAHTPGAPAYLDSLATRLLAQGGDLTTAIATTEATLRLAQDEHIRAELEDRLKALFLQKSLETLNRASRERSTARRAPARVVGDLVGFAGLTEIPPEPYGGSFRLDAQSGNVTSSDDARLLRLHIHPGEPVIEPAAD